MNEVFTESEFSHVSGGYPEYHSAFHGEGSESTAAAESW